MHNWQGLKVKKVITGDGQDYVGKTVTDKDFNAAFEYTRTQNGEKNLEIMHFGRGLVNIFTFLLLTQ